MGAARRLYLYVVAIVSLAVAATGIYNLLAVLLAEVADRVGATILETSTGTTREQVSLAIALVVVGVPIWLIHWRIAERGLRGNDARAAADRASTIRAVFLFIVSIVALAFAATAAIDVFSRFVGVILGADMGPDASDQLAILLTALPIWYFHVGVERRGPIGPYPRLYRYGVAFVVLAVVLFAGATAIGTFLEVVIGRPEFGLSADWWRASLAWSIAAIVVGLVLWWIHWRMVPLGSSHATGHDDERVSRLRETYFGAVLLLTVSFVAVDVAGALAEIGRWVLGSAETSGLLGFLEGAVGPLVAAVPFVIAGWLHVRYRAREAVEAGPLVAASSARVEHYLLAVAGLAFLAVGVGQLLGAVTESLLVGDVLVSDEDFLRRQVPWFVAQAIVGLVVWLPAWTWILRRRAAAPEVERRAAAGRAYLFLVVGVALLACVPSAAFVLYRLIDTALGGHGFGLAAELAMPLAAIVVGAVVAIYHGAILRGDLRATVESPPAAIAAQTAEAAEAMPGVVPATLPASASMELVLSGPGDADLEAVADELRRRLPSGMSLERRAPSVEPHPT
jgi:hypothetical protein